MNSLVVLPIILPQATAALCFIFWRNRRFQKIVGVVGAAGLLGVSLALLASVRANGIQVMQMGGWPAPFGITLVADLFSSIMVVLAGIKGVAITVYSLVTTEKEEENAGYYPLVHILLMGVCGAFLTGDLFNMYVWFEVLLIASFVLLGLGGKRAQLEGAVKYVTLNLVSSTLFLTALGILYSVAGTLNMADLSIVLENSPKQGLVMTISILFLVAFGIKAAIFPLFFWLPASYHTPPAATSALFAGLLTKVGVYALIRVFTLLFVQDTGYTHSLILVLSGLTMVTGVLGAAAHYEIRKILSFHIISQIGYMIMGLGLMTRAALAGSVLYIIHHIIVKTNLFLVSGIVRRLKGSYELKRIGGLYHEQPFLALLFLIPALSLAGVPPLSGFFSKLVLIREALTLEQYGIVVTALVVSLLTLFSMTKIWAEAFWKAPPEGSPTIKPVSGTWVMFLPVVGLALLTLCIGLSPEPFLDLALRAADQLLDPTDYRLAVLGPNP